MARFKMGGSGPHGRGLGNVVGVGRFPKSGVIYTTEKSKEILLLRDMVKLGLVVEILGVEDVDDTFKMPKAIAFQPEEWIPAESQEDRIERLRERLTSYKMADVIKLYKEVFPGVSYPRKSKKIDLIEMILKAEQDLAVMPEELL